MRLLQLVSSPNNKRLFLVATFSISRIAEDSSTQLDSTGGIIPEMNNNNPDFIRNQNTPSSQLNFNSLTEQTSTPFNSTYPDGKNAAFRTLCTWSHFAFDDPIVFPGRPGAAHLQMFFGNTTKDKLINTGGGSCQGGELNRTGYWMPALQDAQGRAKVPTSIVVYYKTKNASTTQAMPQGLELIAGDSVGMGSASWACGANGYAQAAICRP